MGLRCRRVQQRWGSLQSRRRASGRVRFTAPQCRSVVTGFGSRGSGYLPTHPIVLSSRGRPHPFCHPEARPVTAKLGGRSRECRRIWAGAISQRLCSPTQILHSLRSFRMTVLGSSPRGAPSSQADIPRSALSSSCHPEELQRRGIWAGAMSIRLCSPTQILRLARHSTECRARSG